MTIQDRILAYLAGHPEGVDDDALAAALNLRARQQANQRCRRMENFGIVSRRKVNGKIRNFLNAAPAPATQGMESSMSDPVEQPWYWEGNVQAAVVSHLKSARYWIKSTANTATKEQGKDIVAVAPPGSTLWVSAKGYPKGTVRTNPRTQARHWFAHALFDLILWRGQDERAALAVALPDQVTYRNLSARISWFLAATNAKIFWVREDGSVLVEGQ
jgi:hypothetical protein